MTDPLVEYYRCPDSLVGVGQRQPLDPAEGYFAFHGAVCYGRATCSELLLTPDGALPDASADVAVSGGRIELPFELSEVLDNLRHERYYRKGRTFAFKLTASGLSEKIYYFVRPVLSVAVRKHLQRIRLSGWDRISFPRWPVDLTVETLMETVMGLLLESRPAERIPFIWFWPDDASAAAIVTHDVEAPAGYAFCDRLMDIDESFGFRSSFQIIPERADPVADGLLGRLRDRGFEINVHDLNHDGHLFRDRDRFLERAQRINQYSREFGSRGFRAACMYREQAWFDVLDIAYDMSVPNVAHLEPQRGGCCTVMPFFIRNVLELPLTTIQDYSLFHILGQYSIDLWREQIELVRARHGLITILTHPDYLIERRAQQVYRDLLAHLRRVREEQNVWFALPGDVERWWRNRQQMTLTQDGESWRIQGPGSERASLAYARLEDGRLVYDIVHSH